MDVKACDNCKKLNMEVDKPFALVGTAVDFNKANLGEVDNSAIVGVHVCPLGNISEKYRGKETKMLCSECTMPYATELVKQLFSKENMAKL